MVCGAGGVMQKKKITRLPWPVVARLIDVWIWDDTGRSMLKDKLYSKDVTFEALAEKYHKSVQRTKEIYYENRALLYSHIPQKYFA